MDRLVSRLAHLSALVGGVVLGAVVVMTGASIVGRALSGLGLGPVPGDYELIEAGTAFAVFAFLPIAQLKGGHATVDLFAGAMSIRTNRVLLAFWEVLAALVLALILWRLLEGTRTKIRNGETTLLLQFPIWWAYAACLVPAAATVLVGLWSAADRVRGAVTGRDSRPVLGGGEH